MTKNFLRSLQNARWKIAFKTFGSNHSTLIGILVDWWISLGGKFALDEGCTFSYHSGGKGSAKCDAVLLEGNNAKGVVKGIIEVEGSRHGKTIEKMGKFFHAKNGWESLEFGIFLAYPTEKIGQKEKRHFYFYPCEKKLFEKGRKISAKFPGKTLIVLILEKKYDRKLKFSVSQSEYYAGRPIKIYGRAFLNGKEIKNRLSIQ